MQEKIPCKWRYTTFNSLIFKGNLLFDHSTKSSGVCKLMAKFTHIKKVALARGLLLFSNYTVNIIATVKTRVTFVGLSFLKTRRLKLLTLFYAYYIIFNWSFASLAKYKEK